MLRRWTDGTGHSREAIYIAKITIEGVLGTAAVRNLYDAEIMKCMYSIKCDVSVLACVKCLK